MCARAGHGEDWARQRFSRAGHMREALNELSQQAEKQEEDAKKQKAKPGRFSRQDDLDGENGAAGTKRGKLPRITGIRHWTTPDYTRIAIDLEQEIKFESQRIDHPDRIFFDLYDTKLASTLIGK